jgi:hypothetical protein
MINHLGRWMVVASHLRSNLAVTLGVGGGATPPPGVLRSGTPRVRGAYGMARRPEPPAVRQELTADLR